MSSEFLGVGQFAFPPEHRKPRSDLAGVILESVETFHFAFSYYPKRVENIAALEGSAIRGLSESPRNNETGGDLSSY